MAPTALIFEQRAYAAKFAMSACLPRCRSPAAATARCAVALLDKLISEVPFCTSASVAARPGLPQAIWLSRSCRDHIATLAMYVALCG
jgi:hypothetical protein